MVFQPACGRCSRDGPATLSRQRRGLHVWPKSGSGALLVRSLQSFGVAGGLISSDPIPARQRAVLPERSRAAEFVPIAGGSNCAFTLVNFKSLGRRQSGPSGLAGYSVSGKVKLVRNDGPE